MANKTKVPTKQEELGGSNMTALIIFLSILLLMLGILAWAFLL